MATPVYGKQFIRFAETGLVPDAVALNQFTMVGIDASAATEPPTLVQQTAGGAMFGVLQQDVPAVDTDKATTLQRLGTVATSGLLLIAADSANMPAIGANLTCDSIGLASSAGALVTVDAKTPTIRQHVNIGGVAMVLVSV